MRSRLGNDYHRWYVGSTFRISTMVNWSQITGFGLLWKKSSILESEQVMRIMHGEHSDKKVFIFMVDTLVAFQKTYGNLAMIDMLRMTNAYTKIMDEIHLEMKALSMIDVPSIVLHRIRILFPGFSCCLLHRITFRNAL